ncbi:hypothetical protein [Rugamonas sp.]|uniref:hypothetical protein n=1 Tax=Rugamonas sp. TaxID=1926287 RepID=UPI0025E9336F|nr:hypothetical protein [Rugamonas sp.]
MDDGAATTLASTAALLVTGGDERIVPDGATGRTRYGCAPAPDAAVAALGSSTATNISAAAFAAAAALRAACAGRLRTEAAHLVYARETARQRAALLDYCGLGPDDGVDAVLAASGTDIHLLAAGLCRPRHTVLISACETGSGVPLALQGRHFNGNTACGAAVTAGAAIGDWHGATHFVASREADGGLRPAAAVDADYADIVSACAADGAPVLLALTDVSKTGLIAPGIAAVLALRARYPGQLDVLVDGCQFRLAPATVRAYLAQGFMVALTGSKFMTGPTFCGALLLPPGFMARKCGGHLSAALAAYSAAGDWPDHRVDKTALPALANFGLLLRWEAALFEMRRYAAVSEAARTDFLRRFGAAVGAMLSACALVEVLPVAAIERGALGVARGWDAEQTIFPFLLKDGDGAILSCERTLDIYRRLQAQGWGGRRFQLGQPVLCGQRDGRPISALRLCASARMVADACGAGGMGGIDGIDEARAALTAICALIAPPPAA